MYNRYVSPGCMARAEGCGQRQTCDQEKYTQIHAEPQDDERTFQPHSHKGGHKRGEGLRDLLDRDKLGGLLGTFGLNGVDTGDILLFLIILFLLTEGDELDLLITLGLTLLMSLGGEKKDRHPGNQS